MHPLITSTPAPPYYAVIFTSVVGVDDEEFGIMAEQMERLVKEQPGYLGLEYAGNEIGITISYWKDEESIRNWKQQADHLIAQQKGKEKWYAAYKIRICKVERDYDFEK